MRPAPGIDARGRFYYSDFLCYFCKVLCPEHDIFWHSNCYYYNCFHSGRSVVSGKPNIYLMTTPAVKGNKVDTKELLSIIVDAAQDVKATGITLLGLSHIETAPSSEFVVITGRSTSQVSSIADNIRDKVLDKTGLKPYNYDGYRNSQWIVIDYGNVMVHIFLPDTRTFYNIEDLWSDAEITEIPDLD